MFVTAKSKVKTTDHVCDCKSSGNDSYAYSCVRACVRASVAVDACSHVPRARNERYDVSSFTFDEAGEDGQFDLHRVVAGAARVAHQHDDQLAHERAGREGGHLAGRVHAEQRVLGAAFLQVRHLVGEHEVAGDVFTQIDATHLRRVEHGGADQDDAHRQLVEASLQRADAADRRTQQGRDG